MNLISESSLCSDCINSRRAFRSADANYIVVERVETGSLFDQVTTFTTYTERDGCFIARQLFSALAYLQEKRVVHRNITAENLLIEKSSRGEHLKLTDFGLAIRLPRRCKSTRSDSIGTPLYAAPEVFQNEPVSYAVDCWSAGIILYLMLGGYPPFWAEEPDNLCSSVQRCKIEFISPYWDNVSQLAKDVVAALLRKDTSARLTASQTLEE